MTIRMKMKRMLPKRIQEHDYLSLAKIIDQQLKYWSIHKHENHIMILLSMEIIQGSNMNITEASTKGGCLL